MEEEKSIKENYSFIKLIGIGIKEGKEFFYPLLVNIIDRPISMVQGTSDGFCILFFGEISIKVAIHFNDLIDLLESKNYIIHEDLKYLYDYYKKEFFKNLTDDNEELA